jgi:HPt (histidine-containing phosphotransfer) domain-containing protein
MSQLVMDRPVRSSKSADPDFGELIEMFVGESSVRATQMQTLFARGDFEQLQRMAHQLRGSGAGYGFELLSDLATSLESACENGDPCDIAETLHDTVGYLIRMEC